MELNEKFKLTIVLKTFENLKRGASTFHCNAGRLLLIVTRGVYCDEQTNEIL